MKDKKSVRDEDSLMEVLPEKSNEPQSHGVIGTTFDPRVLFKQILSGRIRQFASVPVALAILAVGSWFYYHQTYAYSTVQYSNGGHTYSFRFTKGATISSISGTSYVDGYSLQDFKKVAVVIKPTDDLYSVNFNCGVLGIGWDRALYEQVDGQSVPVCTDNKTSYEMVFADNAKDYLAEVVSRNGTATINSVTVNTIFSSIVVK